MLRVLPACHENRSGGKGPGAHGTDPTAHGGQRITRAGVVAFCLLTVAGPASATTYYITSSGNDAAAGTSPAEAWGSPARISGVTFGPGDSILFEGGVTFRGRILIGPPSGGTATHPVTFTSIPTANGRRAIIASSTETGFYAENCGGVRICNLNFEGSGRTTNTGRGIELVVRLSGSAKKESFTIDSAEVHGYRWAGIFINGAKDRCGLENVVITHCDVHDNGDAGIVGGGPFVSGSPGYNHRNITVARCRVYNNAGVPNRGGHTGNGIVLAFVDGALIEDNEAFNNGWLNDYAGGGPVGMWCWESTDVTIQHNESHHNKTGSDKDGGGFDLDGGTTHSVIQYNYSHDNQGPGYLLAQFEGANPLQNVVIRYNISENDGGGILLWSSGSHGGIRGADIYNNTIYTQSPLGGVSIISDDIFETKVLNNIVQTTAGCFPVKAAYTPDVLFAGNCYWVSGGDFMIQWGNSTCPSLEAWRGSAGQEQLSGNIPAGLQVDPQLTLPGEGVTVRSPGHLDTLTGYRLKAESQLINAGINLHALFGIHPGERDFFGTPLPQGSEFDIGAHEYGALPVPVACPPVGKNSRQ